MQTRTKIICTIGPAVDTLEKMIELIEAGMNVARLNFSHGNHEEHLQRINNLKEARKRTKRPLAIMLDTKGPEIRIGEIGVEELLIKQKHRWQLVAEEVEGDEKRVTVRPGNILKDLEIGTRILFDDGYVAAHVIEKNAQGVIVEIENGGILSSNKGINIPNVDLDLPAMTERDIDDIRFGCKQGVEMVAASFVRSADHLVLIKKLLAEEKSSSVKVIAKIENHQGINNFDSIVQVADGIMIARGDLGVEVPLSQVPRLQKMMIRKSYLGGKPSVTATQMLESMIQHPRPTRAEASDVANAIYDSTSAVMLSGETAMGRYPIDTVRVMRSIIEEAEADFDYHTFFQLHAPLVYHDVPSAVTLATVKTAYSSNAKAIFAFTTTGSTARLISRLRPPMPIIAMTHDERSYNQMAFNWGVIPFLADKCHTIDEAFAQLSTFCLERKIVNYGDLVVVTAGSPFGFSGTTNMMIVESIGDVLIRGHEGVGARTYANATFLLSPEDKPAYSVRGQIIVIGRCDETYLEHMTASVGIILQNHIDDNKSEKYLQEIAEKLEKPIIPRADGALRVLNEGQLITMDPERGLVYKGVVL